MKTTFTGLPPVETVHARSARAAHSDPISFNALLQDLSKQKSQDKSDAPKQGRADGAAAPTALAHAVVPGFGSAAKQRALTDEEDASASGSQRTLRHLAQDPFVIAGAAAGTFSIDRPSAAPATIEGEAESGRDEFTLLADPVKHARPHPAADQRNGGGVFRAENARFFAEGSGPTLASAASTNETPPRTSPANAFANAVDPATPSIGPAPEGSNGRTSMPGASPASDGPPLIDRAAMRQIASPVRITHVRTYLAPTSAASTTAAEALARVSTRGGALAGDHGEVDTNDGGSRQGRDSVDRENAGTAAQSSAVVVSAESIATGGMSSPVLSDLGLNPAVDDADRLPTSRTASAVTPRPDAAGMPIKDLALEIESQSLGPLGVKMRMSGGKLAMTIEAPTSDAARALESIRNDLESAVSADDHTLDALIIKSVQTAPAASASPSDNDREGSNGTGSAGARNPSAERRNGLAHRSRRARGDLLV